MTTEIVFRLGEMLEEELEAFHGQVLSFYNAIATANRPTHDLPGDDVTNDTLSYRKLARFLKKPKDDGFKFSISELRALDRYFTQQQQSLCSLPIFYRNKGVLDNLADSNEVTFAVATRFLAASRTETVSRWDLRAMQILFNKGVFENTKTEVVDIFHHGSDYREIRQEQWNRIFAKRHSSVVSFGSPFTCHATERSLADIFGVEPYTSDATDRNELLPLYFVWPRSKNKRGVNNSAFLIGRRDIPKLFDEQAHVVQNLTHCDRGIIVGDRWYASDRVGKSYGLFIAQRQNKNCTYVNIIGTYAPDTFAVAQSLADGDITGSLPPYDSRSGQQPVLIAVVETQTTESSNEDAKRGDTQRETRTISSSSKVLQSAFWSLDSNGAWVTNHDVRKTAVQE